MKRLEVSTSFGSRRVPERAIGIPVRIARRVLPGRLWNRLRTRFVGHDGEAQVAGGDRPNKPISLLSDDRITRFRAKVENSIDKAVCLLGYQPRFDLDRGMALTEQWARWANLIPDRQ